MKTKLSILFIISLIAIMCTNLLLKSFESDEAISAHVKGYEEDITDRTQIVAKNKVAPDFTVETMDGKQAKLSDYLGKKVILNFWTTWCPPCKAEMPHMQKYSKGLDDKDDVVILGVNLTFEKDSRKKVEQFIESYNLTFPIFLTYDDTIAKTYRISTIPTTYFIDEQGIVKIKIVGALDEQSLAHYTSKLNDSN